MLTFYRLEQGVEPLLFATDDEAARDYAWRDDTWKDANDIVFGWRVEGNPYLVRVEADEAEGDFPGSTGAVEKRYNPGQARDDAGRWTSGPSVAGRPAPYYKQRITRAQNPDSAEWDADRTNLVRALGEKAQPVPAEPAELVKRLREADGGFTYDPSTGMEVRAGFSVSPYGNEAGSQFNVKGESDDDLATRLTAFQVENRGLLTKPGHMVGGWNDPDSDGDVYLDVVIAPDTAEAARQIGAEIGELAFYDFQMGHSVRIGDDETAVELQKRYNPGQPRDQKGRWTNGGVAGIMAGSPGVGNPSPAVVKAVKGLKHYDHGVPNDSDVEQATAYEAMKHDPADPRVAASYESLRENLMTQWNHLRDEGFVYEPQGDQPGYDGSEELIQALEGKRIRVYLTEGGADMPSDHPMLQPVEGVEGLGDAPVLNDVFRAVHDTIGHGVSGGSFGVKGERAAWLAHRATFPEEALPALWNETRGQASWTNAGPHMQKPDGSLLSRGDDGFIPLPERPFAEQKAGWPEGAKF